jgi:cytochrome c-type biogenesis protein CcmH
LAVTLALAVFVVGSVLSAPPRAVDRAQSVGSQIKCPVCSGESIADSPAPLARDMMAYVSELLESGLTDEQVIGEVLGAYGSDAQRLDPVLTPATLALWLAPAAVLVGGVAIVFDRRRRSVDSPVPEDART